MLTEEEKVNHIIIYIVVLLTLGLAVGYLFLADRTSLELVFSIIFMWYVLYGSIRTDMNGEADDYLIEKIEEIKNKFFCRHSWMIREGELILGSQSQEMKAPVICELCGKKKLIRRSYFKEWSDEQIKMFF